MTFWFLGICNAINLLDGLDGLAVTVALILLGGLWYFSVNSSLPLFLFLLMLTLIPFLFFNLHPAKMFMGSAGSLFLGYVLAIVPIYSVTNITFFDFVEFDFSFFILLYFYIIFDTCRVLLYRVLNKKNPFLPDQNHLHHILARRMGVVPAVSIICVINIWYCILFIMCC